MNERKYELTGETKRSPYDGRILHRIKAVRDFGYVAAGEIGGWIEKEKNLSHDGTAWIHNNAQVRGNAQVRRNAQIWDNACIEASAQVDDDAQVGDNACVSGNSCVRGDAEIFGDAWIGDNADIRGIGDVFWIGGIGRRGIDRKTGSMTFFRCKDGKIRVRTNVIDDDDRGPFSGELDAFAKETQDVTRFGQKLGQTCRLAIEMAKVRIGDKAC